MKHQKTANENSILVSKGRKVTECIDCGSGECWDTAESKISITHTSFLQSVLIGVPYSNIQTYILTYVQGKLKEYFQKLSEIFKKDFNYVWFQITASVHNCFEERRNLFVVNFRLVSLRMTVTVPDCVQFLPTILQHRYENDTPWCNHMSLYFL